MKQKQKSIKTSKYSDDLEEKDEEDQTSKNDFDFTNEQSFEQSMSSFLKSNSKVEMIKAQAAMILAEAELLREKNKERELQQREK